MLHPLPTPAARDQHIVENASYFTVAVAQTDPSRFPGERRRWHVLEFSAKSQAVAYALALRRLYRHPPQFIIYAVELDHTAQEAGCAPSQCYRHTALSEKEWYSQ